MAQPLSSGQPVVPAATSAEIEYLRNQAADARSFAKKRRARAGEWQAMADTARRRAGESRRPADRDSYLDDARLYDQRAGAAREDAEKAEAEAARAEAELKQALKKRESVPAGPAADTRPRHQKKSVKPTGSAMPLDEVVGVWKIDDKDQIFVIVQEDPASPVYAYKLEAHTGERVWKGTYTPFEDGDIRRLQNARVVFRYKPDAKEMNPEIPDWARKAVAGKLEWEIELNEPQRCGGSPTLDGKLYPGKVTWDPAKRTAAIDGRGEPRSFTLAFQFMEPKEAYVRTAIRIRPPGIGRPAGDGAEGEPVAFAPLTVLVENQLFHVDVSLPYELAREQGEKLSIKLRGLSGNESETVELIRGGFRRGRPAKYTNYRPLFFGDSKPFLSQSWMSEIGDHVQRIDLDLENGESVAIGFDRTFEVVPVYKDMEEYTIARYLEAAGVLEQMHRTRLVLPGVSRAVREDAHIRLLRLKNFRILMNNRDNPKWLRVLLAEEYLGPVEDASLVASDPTKMYGAGQIRIKNLNTRAFVKSSVPGSSAVLDLEHMWPNELNEWERNGNNDRLHRFDGIIWSNKYELIRVTELVSKKWRERVRQAFDNFMVNITLGLYEWALSEMSIGYGRFRIGVADAYALVSGEDHYGHDLPKGKRLEIIGNVLLSNLTDYAGEELRGSMIDEISGYQAPGDKLLTIKDVARAVRGRNAERHRVKLTPPPGSQKQPELPKTLKPQQKESADPASAIDGADTAGPVAPVSCAPPRAQFGASGAAEGPADRALLVASRYGENAVVKQQDAPDARTQDFGTCQAEAVLHAAGVEMNPVAVLRLMADNSPEFAQKLRSVSREEHPLVYGFTESEMELLASVLGRKSIPIANQKQMSMAALKNWRERGWAVKMTIHADDYTGPGDNKHSVDVVSVEQNSSGCGYDVTVYDKGIGGTVTMPAEDFKSRLADWSALLHKEDGGKASAPTLRGKSGPSAENPPPRAGPPGRRRGLGGPDGDAKPSPSSAENTPVDRRYGEKEARDIINALGPKEKDKSISRADAVKLFDARMSIRTPEQLAADAANRAGWIPGRKMTLHDLIKQMPAEDQQTPMHVTTTPALFEIAASGTFDIPAGASFSQLTGVTGSLHEGNVAIRVRDGHEGYVELVPEGAWGTIPHYWPSGQHNVGQRNASHIPTEHLEYLDPGRGPGQERWVPFPQSERDRSRIRRQRPNR